MASLYGLATVYGISGSIIQYGSVTGGDRLMQDQTWTNNFELAELRNQQNEKVTFAVTNQQKEISVTFVPVGGITGSAGTIAKAQEYLALPSTVTLVTLTGCPDAAFSGSFAYMGGGNCRVTNNGFAVVTMPLVQYGTSANTTFLTTVVT